jgi:hypothetical protein
MRNIAWANLQRDQGLLIAWAAAFDNETSEA